MHSDCREPVCLVPVDARSRFWTRRRLGQCWAGWMVTLGNMSTRWSVTLVPSAKQSSGSSRSSASSGIFLRISSGSGQSTVLPSEELVSSTPCGAEAGAVNVAL